MTTLLFEHDIMDYCSSNLETLSLTTLFCYKTAYEVRSSWTKKSELEF